VFQTELSNEDIRAIKNIIQKECEEEQGHSISVNGFIAFQKKCIEMLKIQICWNILKHFDYNADLEIRNNQDSFAMKFEEGEALELSNDAVTFLQRIYTFAVKSAEEGEGDSAMEKLFEPAPEIPL
jgi:mitochondrial Rho GTPase 1